MLKWIDRLMSIFQGQSKSMDMVTCRQVIDLLSDYINDEISPEDKRLLEKHFEGCKNCEAFLKTLRQSINLVKDIKYEDIPEEVSVRLRNTLKTRIKPHE